jgi:hypothetical protein
MKARTPHRTAGLIGPVAILAGCYTTTNVATMAPLHTTYPVSASSQYIDQGGAIVTEQDYQVVQPFSFVSSVQAAPHSETLTALAFEPDLDRIMSAAQGDAITGMKVQVTNYDIGSHGSSAAWKILGWTIGLTGATFVALGAAAGNDQYAGTNLGTNLVATGTVTAGIGVVSYLIGAALNRPARWQLEVSGKVVKRTSPAVQATRPITDPAR